MKKSDMRELFAEKKDCFGCGACSAACSAGAITMRRDEEGFLYPVIDGERCVDCGACEKVCPARQSHSHAESRFYAVRCKDPGLLRKSTSGGAFSLVAQEVLAEGGLVCGACFDDQFRVRHIVSENIDGMRKSKYVQSDMGDCFVRIRQALGEKRQVLFSGTPCQCQALKLFLGENRGGLTVMTLVCRGVLSPGLWESYTRWLGGDSSLQAYDFRDKRFLNDAHTVAYRVDGKEKAVPWGEDRFSRIYSKCIALRPSCYACPWCDPESDFDFTVGDFWGVEKVCPELADGKGTSLVIARGEKAGKWMDRISSHAQVIPCTREEAMQPALEEPARTGILRKLLFNDYKKKDAQGNCDMALILKKYGA